MGLNFRTADDMSAILGVKLRKRLGFGMSTKLHLLGMHVEGKVSSSSVIIKVVDIFHLDGKSSFLFPFVGLLFGSYVGEMLFYLII